MDINHIEATRKLLADTSQRVVMVVHSRPDGDAMGSALGLMEYFKILGFTHLHVIAPDEYASFLHWMPGNNQVVVAESNPGNAHELLTKAQIIICLDFNGFSRAGKLSEMLENTRVTKIMIDHHPDPESGFDLYFSDTSASSTAELIYEFIEAMGHEDMINLPLAQCLYTGMVTDTGSFSYGFSKPRTHEIAARLIGAGVDGARLHRLIYNTYSPDRMRLLGYCLGKKLRVFEKHKMAYIGLTLDELAHYNYREGDTEGIVNYALSIRGIELAALFMEREDHVKVSFRSAGQRDVNLLARKHYQGGGHRNAAGGRSDHPMEETLRQFENLIVENHDVS